MYHFVDAKPPIGTVSFITPSGVSNASNINHDQSDICTQAVHNSIYCVNKAMHGVLWLQTVTVEFNIFNQITNFLVG